MFDSTGGPGKLTVRNLAPDVFSALTELASLHDRSLEAEARQAIRAWVQPQLTREGSAGRALAVGQRLSYLLAEANQFASGRPVTVSKIAELAAYTHAGDLEDWFAGDEEPAFSDLERISSVLGCSRTWLVHGDGNPYRAEYTRIPEDPPAAAAWFLRPALDGGAPPELSLLRSTSAAGEFALVKHHSALSAQTFHTPYHLSDKVGAGGETSQVWLALGLQALHREFAARGEVLVKGYLVEPTVFSQLLEGRKHPLNVLNDARVASSPWWEDIWDEEQFGRGNYWDGWDALVRRIQRHIGLSRPMAESRALLQSGAGRI